MIFSSSADHPEYKFAILVFLLLVNKQKMSEKQLIRTRGHQCPRASSVPPSTNLPYLSRKKLDQEG